jgi:hypothetical protein
MRPTRGAETEIGRDAIEEKKKIIEGCLAN